MRIAEQQQVSNSTIRITIDKTKQMCYNTDMEETTIETPKYTVIDHDAEGREIRLYADGSKRNWRGQLIENPPYAVRITADTSEQYNKRRKQKILEAIEARITDVTKMNHPAEAIAAIVGKRAAVAMSDDTRTGNDAAKIVLAAVDAYQDKAPEARTNVLRHEYAIDEETQQLLHAMIRERRDNDILDGNIE